MNSEDKFIWYCKASHFLYNRKRAWVCRILAFDTHNRPIKVVRIDNIIKKIYKE